MSLVSVGIVLISLACMCINTFPSMAVASIFLNWSSCHLLLQKVMDSKNEPADNPRLALVEVQPLVFFVKMWKYSSQAVCISFFTVEFLLRLAGSPDKIIFLKYPILFKGCHKRNYTFIGPVGHSNGGKIEVDHPTQLVFIWIFICWVGGGDPCGAAELCISGLWSQKKASPDWCLFKISVSCT